MSKITLQQSVHSITVIVGFAAYMHLSAHCKLRKSTTEHHVKLSIQRLHNSLCLLLLLIKLALLLSRGILVLLVLRHQVVHVGLSLSELHLIHTLACNKTDESEFHKTAYSSATATLKDLQTTFSAQAAE